MGLFDLNVRYYLERSAVNRQIINTLKEDIGRKNFYLFNNGVTISCEGWGIPTTPKKNKAEQSIEGPVMTLRKPQIINGCQTVISIHRAYHQLESEYERRHLEENCLVPVRIIQTNNREILYQVVTASNNQNKMSPRNLHSNSREQRNLQKKFAQLKPGWFYERKDGEFDSIRKYPTRDFKLKDFQYGVNGSSVRKVSNEDIAKAWLSFVGFSSLASENISAFDSIDDGGHYEWLFEKCPNENQWKLITLGKQVELSDDNFELKIPSPQQYLLSYIILEFVKAYVPTPQANRKECTERLLRGKLIRDDAAYEDVNKKLVEDETYVLNQILSNMKEVIVELFAWIFVKTYGPINGQTAEAILRLPGFVPLVSQPDFKAYVKELNQADPNEKLQNVLFTCAEFIKQSVLRWQSVYKRDYLASQRRIRFLHLASTIEQMKNYLEETNASTRVFQEEWKPPKRAFLESLPKLQ